MTAIDAAFSAVTSASGVCAITITTGARSRNWTVTQISVEMPSAPATALCLIRKNNALITPVLPTYDTAAGDPPITLNPNDILTVTWTGAIPASLGKVTAFYDDGRNPV